MTPQRWARIKEIFGAAFERPESDRRAFLNSACDGDAELRAEVERLLKEGDDPSLYSPASGILNAAVELTRGETVGHYRIESRLGEGGMGLVYKASDTRLRRSVALKFVKEGFSQRSEREARAVAALNHPNICTLHDVGPNYLVMELIEGPTLAARLAKGRIAQKEALVIARQIAEALEAAHEKGIVHRDLKPANIKLTAESQVKVLDFGLAKVQESAAGGSEEAATLTVSATRAGMILGTAAYMSPEQASGKSVDKRADIWSFGVVLWEMVTGHRLFEGETFTQTLAEVLRGPIDFDLLPRDTPAEIRRLLRRCLDRNVQNRLRDIGEARIAIEAALAGETLVEGAPNPDDARRMWLAWSVAGALAMGVASLAFLHFREKPTAPAAPARVQITPPENTTLGALLSVYTARHPKKSEDIWVLPLDSDKTPVPFLVTEFNEGQARFSPDGHFVAYTSNESGQSEVYVRSFSMNSAGTGVVAGAKWQISNGFGDDPRWRGDGRELYYRSRSGGILAVEIATNPAFRAANPQPLGASIFTFGGSYDTVPAWDSAADGRRILVASPKSEPRPYTVVLNWQAGLKK